MLDDYVVFSIIIVKSRILKFSNVGSFKEIDYYKVKVEYIVYFSVNIYYPKVLDILFSYSTVETLKN